MTDQPLPLNGKVAIVTGASRGIGRAVAIELARAGALVAVAARTTRPLKTVGGTLGQTAEAIRALGRQAIAVKADISDEQAVAAMTARTLEAFGRIDILVNNAATNQPARFLDMPQKTWDRIMAVNLRGTVLCTRAVLPEMLRRGRGHIINISSMVTQSLRHDPFTGIAYDVTKVAMNRLTLGLAEELRTSGIAVNALMPDNTESDGWAFLNPGIDRSGWDRPEDWGRYVALLAACDPASHTGLFLTRPDLDRLFPH
jgi:NAD(P)-dependent dehydrogenase (short-subunit alcohol dehydrogenase family)